MNQYGNLASFKQATSYKDLPFGGKALGILLALLLVVSMLPVGLAFPKSAEADEINPQFEVQYYANLMDFAQTGDVNLKAIDLEKNINKANSAANGLPSNLQNTNVGEGYLYLNEVNGKYEVSTTTTLTEIYKEEEFSFFDAPVLGAFDIVSQANSNYSLEEIWVLKEGKDKDSTNKEDWDVYSNSNHLHFVNSGDSNDTDTIRVTGNTVLRLVYDQTTGTETKNANFFDYDVTDGKVYSNSSFTTELKRSGGQYYTQSGNLYTGQVYVKTLADNDGTTGVTSGDDMMGINSNNSSAANKSYHYGFGNNAITTNIAWNKDSNGYYVNQANLESNYNKENEKTGSSLTPKQVFGYCSFQLAKTTGLVTNSIGEALPQLTISAPDIFNTQTNLKGKTNIEGWTLGFERTGDTYTFSTVKTNTGATAISDATTFSRYGDNTYSNDFWPMDSASTYGADGHDAVFGYGTSKMIENGTMPKSAPKINTDKYGYMPFGDDGKNHNSYFGMSSYVDFTLQANYVGPLEYIFFGDDDMWVYITEYSGSEPTAAEYAKSQLITDIGGVHSSVASWVNLREFIDNENWANGTSKKYRMSFFYTERGASGSSCYMQFTLPGVTESNPYPTGSLTIDKDSFYTSGTTNQNVEGSYEFSLSLKDADGETMICNYPYTLYSKGSDGVMGTEDDVAKPTEGSKVTGLVGGGVTSNSLTIGGNEYIKVEYLPLGASFETNFSVSETSKGNFTTSGAVTKGDAEVANDNKTINGAINAENPEAVLSYDNIYATSELSISKNVTGNAGDENVAWSFEVSLTAPEGITLASSFPCTVSNSEGVVSNSPLAINKDGEGTVSLKHGETAIITGLPVGTTYNVTEGAHDGYTSSASFNDSKKNIAAGETDYVTFTNNKNYVSVAKIWNDNENTFTGDSIEVNLIDICHPIINEEDQSAEPSKNIVETVSLSADENGDWKYEWTNLSGEHEWTVEEVTKIPGYVSGIETSDTNGLIVTLTNTLQTGELEINKTVIGNAGDTEKDWTFQITLTDPEGVDLASSFPYVISNSEGVVTNSTLTIDENGVGTITLKHGQTAIISKIPVNTEYDVTETNAEGYEVNKEVVDSDSLIHETTNNVAPAKVSFTNEHNAVRVLKEWKNDGNTFIGESIQVELIDTCHDANGNEITEDTAAEGKVISTATISPNDEDVWYYKWTNANTPELLGDHSWTVREIPVDGYTSKVSKISEDGSGLSEDGSKIGTITQITNTIETGDLVVSKMVDGNAGDTNKAWEFTVTLKDSTNVALKDAFTYEVSPINAVESEIDTPVVDTPSADAPTVEEGVTNNTTEGENATEPSAFTRNAEGNVVFTVSLKHNEKVTLSNLPAGIEYIIDETEANKDGYITTINGMITLDGSSKGTVSADETAEAEYQNTCDVIFPGGPTTGDTILPLAAFAGLALVSIIIALIARRNMRKN